MFRIFFSSHGDRAFGGIPEKIRQRIIVELESLAADHLWYRRVRKLHGAENQYRLRVGRWRVLFLLKSSEIEILDVFMKKGKEDYPRRIS